MALAAGCTGHRPVRQRPRLGITDFKLIVNFVTTTITQHPLLRLPAHLQAHFRLSLAEAASRLGVCASTLKRVCRRKGIPAWPQRKLVKLSRAVDQESLHSFMRTRTVAPLARVHAARL